MYAQLEHTSRGNGSLAQIFNYQDHLVGQYFLLNGTNAAREGMQSTCTVLSCWIRAPVRPLPSNSSTYKYCTACTRFTCYMQELVTFWCILSARRTQHGGTYYVHDKRCQ